MTESERWPDIAGRIEGGRHILPVRVYYEDTDASGLVYHASYLRFLERGRSDFLRLIGIRHDTLAAGAYGEPLLFTVRGMTVDFLRPARLDEVIEVETRPVEIAGARGTLTQTVSRGEHTLVRARVTVALVNAAGRPRRLPAELRRLLVASQMS
ncbi:MAG: tol-pal system-associated acyl-CoA thioesterase [Bauldia sp.]